jgi:hypothetical protein
MKASPKQRVKDALGKLPLVPEMEWFLRRRDKPVGSFILKELNAALPEWAAQVAASPLRDQAGKKVYLFGVLRYWIQHTTLMSLALAGLGHEVTLGYLPLSDWLKTVSDYDLRLQNLYAKRVLAQAEPLIETISLLDVKPRQKLPEELERMVKDLSVRDYQYTRQVEEVNFENKLFKLRMERNRFATQTAFTWLEENRPDVLIVPNGLILELGAVFETARYFGIPVVSYEFGEQRERIWLSLNSPVMFQDTAQLWEAYKEKTFSDEQLAQVDELYASRQSADLWRNFKRQWQDIPTEGEAAVREKLGLDGRPVVLLAANVIGDSLTLGRQVFSENMTEWLERTLEYFARKEQVQFLLRVHPGERYVNGPSVVDIVEGMLAEVPPHIHIIAADDPVNTYDLISITDLGLAYTTTVGMEMAMSGVPAVVVGRTHYRGKGFTIDPDSWEGFFEALDSALDDFEKMKLSEEQVRMAWHYAYCFYFDYPQPFPWHLRDFWKNMEAWPLRRMLTEEGQKVYGRTFELLVGGNYGWEEG